MLIFLIIVWVSCMCLMAIPMVWEVAAESTFAIWDRYIQEMSYAKTDEDLYEICYALSLFKKSRGFSTTIEDTAIPWGISNN